MLKILFRKPAWIMMYLKEVSNKSISDMTREVDASYTYMFDMVKKLEAAELVSVEKKDRRKLVNLTQKGLEMSEQFIAIEKLLQ